ncbi:MAG TPA: hypothetical protein VM694_19520, partial [Polyangium sp.]|nr:hypothetical protein [Polyangium sp.]
APPGPALLLLVVVMLGPPSAHPAAIAASGIVRAIVQRKIEGRVKRGGLMLASYAKTGVPAARPRVLTNGVTRSTRPIDAAVVGGSVTLAPLSTRRAARAKHLAGERA